ncbi:hypothetical protein PC116_g25578 [Phytophthora cactorum]|uniref:Uncharacterized protein n=1 Tax=Phytophthora cactorum TaxID=29920 RepID=A0A8T1B3U7_9STRA|nr:hypothetical protein Pcac1_g10345 [Phytophthora cactorum]KAG2877314.1 hypothetical protein PC114_g23707 [Phytophthora cactorum]KAG2894358.1 hypothetical protein PC117_g23505 [Phytophthora cactorum]KAG2972215.1 hypothetical protein PC119_g23226 [Phytophthora cactorum]KAG2990495.1 hypothetical protein PC120_g22932 [Phytophthora cactorum]
MPSRNLAHFNIRLYLPATGAFPITSPDIRQSGVPMLTRDLNQCSPF